MTDLDPTVLRSILQSAIEAPSADNRHPVWFDVENDIVHIVARQALPPSGGYRRALALMSLGALTENLVIAATRFQLKASVTLHSATMHPDRLLRIGLEPAPVESDPLYPAISLRHTNRRVVFRGPALPAEEKARLERQTDAYPGSRLIWLRDTPLRRPVLRLMRRAETARFRVRELHAELFSAIRFDAGWHARADEGLPPGALGVEPLLRPAFALMRHWAVMRTANLVGMHHVMGWRACDLPCRIAPDVGILTTERTDDLGMLNTGRAFQRVWLNLSQQGRALQPMPAAAIFALQGAASESVPQSLQHALALEWRSLSLQGTPLMLFRTGISRPLRVNAGRLPIDAYVRSSDWHN